MFVIKEGLSIFLAAVIGTGGAGSEIGVAMSQGSMSINQKRIPGTATLFSGALVETSATPSTLLLPDSMRIDLASSTAGVIYKDHMELKSGTARLNLRQGAFFVQTDQLIFKASSPQADSVLRQSRAGVDLSVKQGEISIHGIGGTLLARASAGDSLRLSPGPNDTSKSRVQLTGKLEKVGDRYILKDRATHITQEIVGKVPVEFAGKVVTVIGEVKPGKTPLSPAERIVAVERSRRAGGGFPCFSGGGNGEHDRVVVTGPVRFLEGRAFLTDDKTKVVFELNGKVQPELAGTIITVKGIYNDGRTPFAPAEQLISIEALDTAGGGYMSTCMKAWIGTSIVTATGVALGITLTREDPLPISR